MIQSIEAKALRLCAHWEASRLIGRSINQRKEVCIIIWWRAFQRGARKWLTLTNFNPENYTNTNLQIQIKNTNTNLQRENSI